MTGYRSGFVAGDPELSRRSRRSGRPSARRRRSSSSARRSSPGATRSTSPRTRERYARKRALFLDLFARKGIRVAGSAATMYLWLAVPDGETSEGSPSGCSSTGSWSRRARTSAPAGEGYVRLALVPTEDECARAAAILEEVL